MMFYLRGRRSLKCIMLIVSCLSLLLGYHTSLLNELHSKTQKWRKVYYSSIARQDVPRPLDTVKEVLHDSLYISTVKGQQSALASRALEVQAATVITGPKPVPKITTVLKLDTQNFKKKANKQTAFQMRNETPAKAVKKVAVNTIKNKVVNVTKSSETRVASTTFYLGEAYEEDETYLMTNCSNGIRKRILSSPFQKQFLDRIPVLLWGKHMTKENYERLKKNVEPFGWKATSTDVLNKSLQLLNTSANTYMFDDLERLHSRSNSSCIRCAVVGNGGILRNSNKGNEIDSHDYVFRVNGAIIKGFEKDVGKRTSFYAFSTNTMMNSLTAYASDGFANIPQSEETRYLFLPDHNRDYMMIIAALTLTEKEQKEIQDSPKHFGKNLKPEKFKILHPDFIRYLRNRFLRSYILQTSAQNIYRPSTGAIVLLAAVHTCDEVSAYGFITQDYKKYSDHYYDQNHKEVFFYINHDFQMEMKLWESLHQNKLIKLYKRS